MNTIDVSQLSQEVRIEICDLMGGDLFRKKFIEDPEKFTKIKPGFRVKKLTEAQALNTAKRYMNISNARIIYHYINSWIKDTLNEIKDKVFNFEKEGKTKEEAFCLALMDSPFSKHIPLFFKIYDGDITEDQFLETIKRIEEKKQLHLECTAAEQKATELEEKNCELEKIITELTKQLQIAQDQLEGKKSENKSYATTIKKKDLAYHSAMQKIEELERKITELTEQLQDVKSRNELNTSEISEKERLLQFEDKLPADFSVLDSETTISLCKVSTDYSGNWLLRKADIDAQGRLSIFIEDKSQPRYFSNRNKLFQKNGPTESGIYAVWNWSTKPNYSDPEKDYVLTDFDPNISPIEIITCNNCITLNDVIEKLKVGLKIDTCSNGEIFAKYNRVLFAIHKGKGQYEGILCKAHDLTSENEIVTFSKSAIWIPVYQFSSEQVLKLDDDKMFYKTVYAGIPNSMIRVKDTLEIIQSIIVDSISWKNYKSRCIAKTEYDCFKELIASIPSESIIEKIKLALHCTDAVASEKLAEFISKISNYVNTSCLEDKVIISALNTNDTLMNHAKALIQDDWKLENTEILNRAIAEQNEITKKTELATKELQTLKATYKELEQKIEECSFEIAEKEQLAVDVEAAVAERIKQAQLKAADFIANMAFVSAPKLEISTTEQNNIPVPVNETSYEIVHTEPDSTEIEEYHNWKDVMEIVRSNLEETGVSSFYVSGLAMYLCACFILKEPLMIVGPNAKNIVEAFHAALCGSDLGVLKCEGNFTYSEWNKIGEHQEQIVLIENLLEKLWMEKITDVFSSKDVMFMAIYPFAEDVQVEPKSIYNYMLPLFTDFLVEKKAKNNYSYGHFADDFSQYQAGSVIKRKWVSKLHASQFVQSRLNEVITIMYDLNSEIKKEDEFIFGFLQYAYATLNYEDIIKAIEDEKNAFSKKMKKDIQLILGDIS